jgi:hypothetical protein
MRHKDWKIEAVLSTYANMVVEAKCPYCWKPVSQDMNDIFTIQGTAIQRRHFSCGCGLEASVQQDDQGNLAIHIGFKAMYTEEQQIAGK